MTAKTNQNAWIVKVTMLLYQEIVQNGKLRKTMWPSNIQKTLTTLVRPIKGFIWNCNTDPSSIFKTSSTLGHKQPTSNLLYSEIEYLRYILNYCLTRLDILDGITIENPVPRVAPSSDETPPPPQTTPEQKNETTIPNAESTIIVCSFNWWWKWNRNAYNEQQKTYPWG